LLFDSEEWRDMKTPIESITRPVFTVDHMSRTVADIDAALRFYGDVLGGVELFRMGPLDASEMPTGEDGRDWMAAHVNVAGARLSLAMLQFPGGTCLQLVQYEKPASASSKPPRNNDLGGNHLGLRVENVPAAVAWLEAHGCVAMEAIVIDAGPLAGKINQYVLDPFGLQLEIVD
jgi:catechol 2,3-dioxygenase-like lactoylglutathione lyase family enzyme